MSDATKIHVWYGDGDCDPLGPIEAELIRQLPNGEVEFLITDAQWLDHTGMDDPAYPAVFTYGPLDRSRFVSRDAYAWCKVGEGGKENRWWAEESL